MKNDHLYVLKYTTIEIYRIEMYNLQTKLVQFKHQKKAKTGLIS